MSKSFLHLVAIAFMAVGFVACGSDNQSSSLKESDSELLRLVARNDLQGVKYQVLKKGANVNAKDKDGKTALMLIYQDGNISSILEVAKFLVEQGANVNAKDKDGKTALMLWDRRSEVGIIGGKDDLEMIKFLIEKGTDLNAKDKNGWTALMHYGNSGAEIDKIKFLVEKGADVNAKTKNGWTALMFAAGRGYGYKGTAMQLLEKGADVNAKNKDGWTALMFAATSNIDIVEMLLEKGADVNAKNKDGKTAIDIADELGRKTTRDVLLKTIGIGE